MAESKYFEEINIGDTISFTHELSESDINKFVELTGDDNPLHTESEYAQNTVFKDRVAHGMLTASFISTLVGKHMPGKGALWISQSFEFLLPVRIGDQLTIMAKVLEKSTSQRILKLETNITNQHKQLVLSGEGRVKSLKPIVKIIDSKKVDLEKVVLITGASRGIGGESAILLAKNGYSVCINYSKDEIGATKIRDTIIENGGKAIICKCDVRNKDEVNGMVEECRKTFGPIVYLVNNATTKIIPRDFMSLEWSDIQHHLDVQLKGALNSIQAILPDCLEYQRGSIVSMGSIFTDSTPPVNLSEYIIAKQSLYALVKAMAQEFGPRKIRFNMVSPGMTETRLIAEVPEKTRLMTIMQTPDRRLAQPIDIANAIDFLLSDKSSHITGETIRICGGQVML